MKENVFLVYRSSPYQKGRDLYLIDFKRKMKVYYIGYGRSKYRADSFSFDSLRELLAPSEYDDYTYELARKSNTTEEEQGNLQLLYGYWKRNKSRLAKELRPQLAIPGRTLFADVNSLYGRVNTLVPNEPQLVQQVQEAVDPITTGNTNMEIPF